MKEILEEAGLFMHTYIKSFYCQDEDIMFGIKMKEEHTGYVQENALRLAESLGLTGEDRSLAELIGLLHDIGRFRQWQLYKTFIDAKSEDHGQLGAKMILELPFFTRLREEYRDILIFAIQNHNQKEIAATNDERKLFFARLIRDADKLDIFRVLAPYLTNTVQASSVKGAVKSFIKGPNGQAEGHGEFSPGFLERFVAGEQVDYTFIKTNEDRKLVRLMWIYDINFSWTMERILEAGYIEAIVDSLPKNRPALLEGVNKLREYALKKSNMADFQ